MTQGATRLPCARLDRAHVLTMTNKNQEHGEKRGVLSTGRARKLQDADTDAADDDTED